MTRRLQQSCIFTVKQYAKLWKSYRKLVLRAIAQPEAENEVFGSSNLSDKEGWHPTELGVHRWEEIRPPEWPSLEPTNGSVESRRLNRHQYPLSVMVWAAMAATGLGPLIFVLSEVKINTERYISEAKLFRWIREHFDDVPWTFQQDSASYHSAKMAQRKIHAYIPAFISKDETPRVATRRHE